MQVRSSLDQGADAAINYQRIFSEVADCIAQLPKQPYACSTTLASMKSRARVSAVGIMRLFGERAS